MLIGSTFGSFLASVSGSTTCSSTISSGSVASFPIPESLSGLVITFWISSTTLIGSALLIPCCSSVSTVSFLCSAPGRSATSSAWCSATGSTDCSSSAASGYSDCTDLKSSKVSGATCSASASLGSVVGSSSRVVDLIGSAEATSSTISSTASSSAVASFTVPASLFSTESGVSDVGSFGEIMSSTFEVAEDSTVSADSTVSTCDSLECAENSRGSEEGFKISLRDSATGAAAEAIFSAIDSTTLLTFSRGVSSISGAIPRGRS